MRLIFCLVTIVALGLLAVGLGEATAQRLAKDDDRAGVPVGKKRRAGSGKTVPITGRLSGTVKVTPKGESRPAVQGQPRLFDTTISATGNLSGVGRFAGSINVPDVKVDLTNRRLIHSVLNGTGTVTTARGEKIFGTYRFRGASIGISLKGEVSGQMDFEITGGTGRFKGATGRAVGTGRGNVFDRTFVADLDGQVELKQDQSQKKDKEVKRDKR
jgi:hypothetical protein